MDKAVTDRIERQVSSAFPDGAITRVQVLQYGDDPEVEPGQAAMRVFFDWPGRSEDKKADPRTVHAFVVANSRALDMLPTSCPAPSGGSSSARKARPDRPALTALLTGSQTADGDLRHRMTCQRTSLR
jgi:hypothetical protein